ncbi:MAG: IS982 family transposase, partial [Flavisolibacter sp.]|nr:IS982 family transposase [Flavisolibacter sp.]
MLPDKVIAIYCFADDLLKSIGHKTKEGCRTTDAEIITTALISALVFKGNQSVSIPSMRSHAMIPLLPKNSGFTKRLQGLCALL